MTNKEIINVTLDLVESTYNIRIRGNIRNQIIQEVSKKIVDNSANKVTARSFAQSFPNPPTPSGTVVTEGPQVVKPKFN